MHKKPANGEAFFSVIIPALNEGDFIGSCISSINADRSDVEIIVADGSSYDETVEVAQRLGATVIRTEPCRGLQCNRGAAIASGEILIFLHADSVLEIDAFDRLNEIFRTEDVEIGNFILEFDYKHWFLRLLSFLSRFDSGLFRYGDQGIIIRRSLFGCLGGFPEWELFEDLALVRAARRQTRIHRFPVSVTTSARRFLSNGIIRQQWINTYYTIQYMLGIPPQRLAKKYYRERA